MRAGRWLVAIAGIATLGTLATIAARLGSADSIAFEASQEMGTWISARKQPADDTWASVASELERARAISPRDPTLRELLGVLRSQKVQEPDVMRQALGDFSGAIALRPSSPYSWANFAEVKYRIGETDAVFETALVRAASLGPSEPEVQKIVADFGLAVWDEVGPETRKAVDRMVQVGLRRNAPEMLQIAGRRGRLLIACRHASNVPGGAHANWFPLCQSTEATS